LNDFLDPGARQRPIEAEAHFGTSVKDLVESLGVPHVEIDLITVNGESRGFDHRIGDGDRIGVYPEFSVFDLDPIRRIHRPPVPPGRFVLDVHLGRLARYLRLFGMDVCYRNDYTDPELVRVSLEENRTLLSRDRELLKRNAVIHGFRLRSTRPIKQLMEVFVRLPADYRVRPFSRCLECNRTLLPFPPDQAAPRVPPGVARRFREFFHCAGCDRLYWKGTHYLRMKRLVERMTRVRS
jgi:hypothetical protein